MKIALRNRADCSNVNACSKLPVKYGGFENHRYSL